VPIVERSSKYIRRGARQCALIILILLAIPTFAQNAYTPYAWKEADLALIYPASWSAPVATSGDGGSLTLTLSGADTTVTLTVLPIATADAAIRPALETQVAALNQLPLRYAQDSMYGRVGLRIDTVSADRQQIGIARSGRLPDDRALLITSRTTQANQVLLETELTDIFDSLVFSAALPPSLPTYHPVWNTALASTTQRIAGIALDKDHLYTVDTDDGVQIFDAKTGAAISTVPFDHPATPTAIAVDAAGIVYVADTVCRCIRKLNGDSNGGRWFDSVGSFGGGAPFSMAVAPNGTIYATDQTDAGYVLRILGDPHDRTVGLNFNASAPPLVTLDSFGNIWVVEWLASLIDGTINAAVSQVSGEKPTAQLQFWLQGMTPQNVSAFSSGAGGDLLFATRDRGIVFVDPHGEILNEVADNSPTAVTFSPDGSLYVADDSGGQPGQIRAFTTNGSPDRFGAITLAINVPSVGIVSEAEPQQSWMFAGTAGQTITLSAVDQSRTDASVLGLDMALRLFAPDGKELAYNDDQLGTDLFGVYDSEISDFTLPQTGTYTVRVEYRQGQGMYTLGLSDDQQLTLNPDGVTEIKGKLQDVFPVQRWAFGAHKGDVLTFTMIAGDGTLDPALALFKPDGKLMAYNDDASDPDLKNNAQLSQVRLPADGTYVIEASRYEGAGGYTITIVNTDQPS